MPDFDAPEPRAAPLPYLTGESSRASATDVMTWKDAPPGAKDAYMFAILGAVIYALLVIVFFWITSLPSNGGPEAPTGALIEGVLFLIVCAINLWLIFAIKKRIKAAWIIQILLSALGLLSIPVGTAIHVAILRKWFTPENKAWFGVK